MVQNFSKPGINFVIAIASKHSILNFNILQILEGEKHSSRLLKLRLCP